MQFSYSPPSSEDEQTTIVPTLFIPQTVKHMKLKADYFNSSAIVFKCFYIFLFSLSPLYKLQAQTDLDGGDIAILGVNAQNNACSGLSGAGEDVITFVSFKDITNGTIIDMTDNGWERVVANRWGDSEGTFRFQRNGGTITAGTSFTITFQSDLASSQAANGGWIISDLNFPSSTFPNLNLNSGGDQLYVMQNGTWDNMGATGDHDATYNGDVLYGFNTRTFWNADGTSQQSNLHPDVNPCFFMNPTSGTTNYVNYTGPTTPATQLEWIERIKDPNNWSSYTTCTDYNNNLPPAFLDILPSGISVSCLICNGCGTVNETLTFSLPSAGGPFNIVYTDGTNNTALNGILDGNTESVTVTMNTTFSIVSVVGANGCPVYSNFDGTAIVNVTSAGTPTTASISACDSGSGSASFDLTTLDATVNNGSGQTVNWYLNASGTTPIPTPGNYISSGGTVYATIGTAPCESTTVAIILTVTPSPTATISASPTSACSGNPVTFTITGTPNATVTYFDGSSNQTVVLDGSGIATITTTAGGSNITYTLVDVTLGSCTATLSDAATVTIAPPPTASISVAPTSACEGIPVTFTFSGTPNATVTYFDGSSNQTVVLNGSGTATVSDVTGPADLTYTLVDVTLSGCTAPANGAATVTITPAPTASLSVFHTTTCPGDIVTFTFTGTPNATIGYDDNGSFMTILLDATGTASVSVPMGTSDLTFSLVDATLNGCSQTLFGIITVLAQTPPTASISVSPSAGACPGDVLVFTITGTPNATVTVIDGNNGGAISNLTLNASGMATTTVIAGSTGFSYTLESVELGNCFELLNSTITVSIADPTASFSVSATSGCVGDMVVFTFTGTPFSTLIYNNGVSNQQITFGAGGVATVNATIGMLDITYTLLSVTLNSCTNVLNQSITVSSSAPTAGVSVFPTVACEGDNVTFTITGTPNATILYNDENGNQSVVLDGTGNATFVETAGTNPFITYSLISATLNGCSQMLSDVASAAVFPLPTVTLSASATSACEGEVVTFTFTGTPGATVTYNNGSGNQMILLDGAGNAVVNVVTGSTNLVYSLVNVATAFCSQLVNDMVVVTIDAAPTASISVAPSSVCENEDAIFTFTGTPNAIVNYDDGSSSQSVLLDGSGNAAVLFTTSASNITFTLIDITLGNCTGPANGSATVTVTPAPTAMLSVAPASVCEGDLVSFTFFGTPNADITYNDGTGNQPATLNNSGVFQITIPTSNTAITYTLVDVTLNGCTTPVNESATVMVTPSPTATISISPTTACENEPVTFFFSGTPNATVNYNNGNTNTFVILDSNGEAFVTTTVGSTDLTFSLINAELLNCAQVLNDAATVTIAPSPTATVSASPITGCEGEVVIFTFTGTPNAVVTYNAGGGNQNILLNGSGTATLPITLSNTNVVVNLVSALLGNCSTTLSNNATATVIPTPVANTASLSACNNGTGQATFDLTSLNATIGNGIVDWLNPAQAPIGNPAAYISGNATVFATLTVNGCTSEPVPVVLTLDDLPTFSNLTDDCTASNLDYVVTFTINGGTAPYTVTGGTGTLTGSQFTSDPIMIGTAYGFFITDANGCGPVEVSGNNLECNCISDAGDMSGPTLNPCIGETVSATHLGNELLDGDDVLLFVLHSNAGNTLGTIYATNTTPDFDLSAIPGLMPNTLYYISAVAGNDLGTGMVDLTDNCLSISQGTPFVIHVLPEASIAAGGFICPGNCTPVLVTLTGTPPFSVNYEINHPVDGVQVFNETTNNAFFNIDVCANGASDAAITITLQTINDAFCDGTFINSVSNTIVGNDLAAGQELYNGCEGDGYSVAVNNVIYNEANPTGTELISAFNGCDSLVTIDLNFSESLTGVENYNGCTGDSYSVTVNGNIYNEANPTGTEMLIATGGCDSLVTINLVFNDALAGTETHNGCIGDGYFVVVNGVLYNETNPTGTETLVSSLGCDSIVSINLAFSNIINTNELYTGCQGDGYSVVVNGTSYNEGNPFGTENMVSGSGCDSIVTINLTFNAPTTGNAFHNGCTGDGYSITLNGNTYNEGNPTGTEIIPNSSGCDSIVSINLTFNDAVMGTESYSGCTGDGYAVTVNNVLYNEANPTGTEMLIATGGCDSVVTINLVFNDALAGMETHNGCIGDGYSVFVNGVLYNETNPTGTETLVSSLGCDSIVSINLTFSNIINTNELYTGCQGDGYSVVVNGTSYNEGNPFGTENMVSGSGCDSIITINLTFNAPTTGNALHNGCTGDGYSITLNGNTYNEGNPTGTEIIPNSSGCDSIVSINLTFNDAVMGTESYSGCTGDGYAVTVNNVLYNEANPTGTELLIATGGCDSVVTINLVFNDALAGTETHNGCIGDGYSIFVNGVLYNETNPTGTETLVSSLGCDSIVSINLAFSNIINTNELYTGCQGDGYSVVVNGTSYNEGNPFGTENMVSGSGCDSIVTINMTFNAPTTGNAFHNGCTGDGYSITLNGNTYNEGNPTGTEIIPNSVGCDSIVSINLVFSDLLNGNENYTGCSGDGYSVMVNGTLYNEANNTGAQTLTSSNGCDSLVVINLIYNTATTGNETHDGCIGDGYSVTVNGTIYNEGNPTGTEILVNSIGCDSIVSINLAFNTSVSGIENYNGCNGDGYEVIVNGTAYNEGNPTGMETLISGGGCDSIVTITLTFNSFLTGSEMYMGCEGDGYSVMVGGVLYNEANPAGMETLASSIGCDSIVTITLVFHPESSGTVTYTGCENDGYAVLVNGTVYNEANPMGMETLTGTTGCDSIVMINLSFSNSLTGEELYNGCENDGYAVVVNGTIYNEMNPTGVETLASSGGCDSIVSINLIYNQSLSGNETYAGCTGDGYSVLVNNTTYNETNPLGMETLVSSTGCDSIVTINLSFSNSLSGIETYSGCIGDGYSIMVNGVLYNESNPTGMETLATNSCDSIVMINLNYYQPGNGSFVRNGCMGDGFEVLIGGVLFNESNPMGLVTLSGANYQGCDSIVNIALSFTDGIEVPLDDVLCVDDFVVVNGTTYDFNNPSGTETIIGGSFFGCDSIINVDLAFYPTVTASISAASFACPGDSTTITFNLEGGVSYNVVFDNGGSILNLNNIADGHTIMVAPNVTTTYAILDVSDPSIPCTPTFQTNTVTIDVSNIMVSAAVQSDFDGFGVSCNGSTDGIALALAENGQSPYVYIWDNGVNGETATDLAAGVYLVTATDAAGCTAEAVVSLTEPTPIQISGTSTAPTCFGDADGTIILDTIFGGSGPYEYSFGDQFFGVITDFPFTIPFVESGVQEVLIQDMNECSVIYNNTVPYPTLQVIDLGNDQEIKLGESYTIPTVTNFDVDTFFWSTLEFMDCGSCLKPEVSPQFTTTYALQAVDENGCSAFNEVTITVTKPRAVYIPNAFSPNGDANNQRFTVFANLDEVVQVNYLRVFDRWGELVFQNNNFNANDERLGWDGSLKGEEMQPGVFVYVAEVLFVDGVVLLYKGDVTLVK